jgi:hypothetical protein
MDVNQRELPHIAIRLMHPLREGRSIKIAYSIIVDDAKVLCARRPSGVVTTESVFVASAETRSWRRQRRNCLAT